MDGPNLRRIPSNRLPYTIAAVQGKLGGNLDEMFLDEFLDEPQNFKEGKRLLVNVLEEKFCLNGFQSSLLENRKHFFQKNLFEHLNWSHHI